jgi:hypothetical protein
MREVRRRQFDVLAPRHCGLIRMSIHPQGTSIDSMPTRRLPRIFFPLAILTIFGTLPAMLIDGDSIRPSAAGLVVIALLLVGVARGSTVAWTLLVIWNAFVVLAVAAAFGGSWLAGAPLLLVNAILCLALLLAPSMRAHLGARRGLATAPR